MEALAFLSGRLMARLRAKRAGAGSLKFLNKQGSHKSRDGKTLPGELDCVKILCYNKINSMLKGAFAMKKAVLGLFIIALFCRFGILLASAEQAPFPNVQTYSPGQFADVSETGWNADSIRMVYERGIMNGTDKTHFSPKGSLTYAQALAIACRLHAAYLGNDTAFETGKPWYLPYVDYARGNGIIHMKYDYEKPATRADFVMILSAALPNEALPEINDIEAGAIPDIADEFDYSASVYHLYRAGVLTGNDAHGIFAPSRSITRGEAAAIVSRILDASLRKRVTLTKEAAVSYTEARLYEVLKEGIENKTGITYSGSIPTNDYIDLSGFGFFNDKDSEGQKILRRVYQEVFWDNPQCFYVSDWYWGYSHDGITLHGIIPIYYEELKDPDRLDAYDKKFQANIEAALKQVEGVTDPIEQMLILHDYLAQINLYNFEIANNPDSFDPWWARSAYGGLDGDCVCKGYALAYQLLLNRLGIHGMVAVNSEKTSEKSHVWNLVELDGNWYHVDVNWDNNPFPTLSGRCRHDYFLVSEETLQRQEGNFKGWTSYGRSSSGTAVCSSTDYESGWAFNDQVDFPMYRRNGGFYYISKNDDGSFILYYGGLTEPGKELARLPIYTRGSEIRSGIVWLDDCLYYVNTDQTLMCYNLLSRKSTQIGKIPFTPKASSEVNNSTAAQDGISLCYHSETGELIASSSTRRVELARFSIAPPSNA